MRACMGCGTPIPRLEMGNGFNFVCSLCECETRPQDSLEKAKQLWNEGMIFPKNEAEYMKNVQMRLKKRGLI